MDLLEMIQELATSPSILVIATIAASLIEISPIKINPLSSLCKWIGKTINAEVIEELKAVKSDVATIKKDQEEDNAENMRCRILSFARSCRRHEYHDAEEWNNIIEQLKKYESYVEERKIKNGVIEENAVYLRELYHERLVNNDFSN